MNNQFDCFSQDKLPGPGKTYLFICCQIYLLTYKIGGKKYTWCTVAVYGNSADIKSHLMENSGRSWHIIATNLNEILT